MKIIITESQLKEIQLIHESDKYVDKALENLNKVGKFDYLNDLDKLILLSASGNYEKCKTLSLDKIYKVNNEFGLRKIKVKVKPVNEQPIDHKFSKESAGKEGYLYPGVHYSDSNEQYVTIRFKEISDKYGNYLELPIMLKNIYPIGYDDDQDEFIKHQLKSDFEGREMKRNLGFDDDNQWG